MHFPLRRSKTTVPKLNITVSGVALPAEMNEVSVCLVDSFSTVYMNLTSDNLYTSTISSGGS